MAVTRCLRASIQADLREKMVFVAGARQVGKTTRPRSLRGAPAGYLGWDVPAAHAALPPDLRGQDPPINEDRQDRRP